ncbi:MAG TPA: ABC transporter permease [Longimicrobium sp.]
MLLLVATGLLVRGLRRAASVEVGFDADRVALVTTDPALLGYGAARAEAVSAELLRRARALPGVEHAALVRFTLLGPAGDEVPAVFAAGAAADSARVAYNVVSPGYLAALGIPLLAGRDLAARDDAGAPGAAVVGEAMARRFWPGRDPLGRRFSVRGAEFEVVGVARDAKYRGLGERALPYVYFSLAQEERLRLPPTALVLHARAAGDPAALLAPLRREVWAVDPDLPAEADLMRRTIRFSLFPARLAGRLVGACGVLALVLASVGLYGIAAYGAARRTREFGIRMALGARGRDVVLLVLRQGLAVTAAGLALGLLAAFWVSGLLRGLLYGVPPGDPATYAGVAALLAAVVLLAGWGPARRAARVDPAVALRVE